MLICTVKPSAVAIGDPNVGVNAVFSEVAAIVFEPLAYPVRVVVIVAVELVLATRPVTVTKPVPLIATVPRPELLTATKPDAVAVPAHV